jgi:hypothetical protein
MAYVQHGKSSPAEYIHSDNCMIISSHTAKHASQAARINLSNENSITIIHAAWG